MKSSTIIGGASSQHGRNAADFYATPPECTIALLENYQGCSRAVEFGSQPVAMGPSQRFWRNTGSTLYPDRKSVV